MTHHDRHDPTRRIEQVRTPAETGRRGTGTGGRPRDLGPLVAGTGAVLGVLWLVVGLVIIARAGIPTGADALDVRATVGPFSGNVIAGAVAIVAGAAYLTVGTQRAATTMFGVGLASIVLGLVWMIEPAAFGDVLGLNRATASIALLTGALSGLVGAVASDTLFRRTAH